MRSASTVFVSGPRITLRRTLSIPVVYAAVFGLFEVANVPRDRGIALGLIAGTAFAGIILISRSTRDLMTAVVAALAGVLVGAPFNDPCTLVGTLIGPASGLITFRTLRALREPPEYTPPILNSQKSPPDPTRDNPPFAWETEAS